MCSTVCVCVCTRAHLMLSGHHHTSIMLFQAIMIMSAKGTLVPILSSGITRPRSTRLGLPVYPWRMDWMKTNHFLKFSSYFCCHLPLPALCPHPLLPPPDHLYVYVYFFIFFGAGGGWGKKKIKTPHPMPQAYCTIQHNTVILYWSLKRKFSLPLTNHNE